MSSTVASRRRTPLAAEEGVALITVLGLSFVLFVLVTAAAAYATNTLPQTRNHEDWNAAMAAAEAGVDDALYRLNQNPNYWATDDPTNEAMSGWRELPGGSDRASYHYQLDASELTRTGVIAVTSTGRVGEARRTIEVRLRRDGFLDYIYFTNFEASDPFALTTNADDRVRLDQQCAVYHPDRDTRPVSQGGCSDIRFARNDVVEGPLRSNDALLINVGTQQPRFLGPVTTGWPGDGTRLYLRDPGSLPETAANTPLFRDGIVHDRRIDFPATSASLAQNAADTGCIYRGPTYIRLVAGAAPSMVVVSPLTPRNTVPSRCGGGSGSSGVSASVPLPSGEVIYVRESTVAPGGSAHPLGLPHPSDNVSTYSRTAGDVFIHGRLRGQLTVASDDSIYLVHDLTYADAGADSSDLLGLIADENVWVHKPVNRAANGSHSNVAAITRDRPPFNAPPTSLRDTSLPPNASAVVWRDPEIHAAILALNRSFGVQHFNRGAGFNGAGEDLTVFGAIAQRWRGPVATAGSGSTVSTGYLKDYVYDYRLQYLTPPYFLEPERSPWGRRQWTELVPAPAACTAEQTPAVDGCLPTG